VTSEARVFTQTTRRRTIPSWRWKASIVASPPPPRVSGGELCEQAAGEAAEGGEEDEQPGPEFRRARPQRKGLAVRAQNRIARELLEQEMLEDLDGGEEERADESRSDADERRVEERAPDDPEIEGPGVRCESREQERVAQGPGPTSALAFAQATGRALATIPRVLSRVFIGATARAAPPPSPGS
jgi:hypothetical protein